MQVNNTNFNFSYSQFVFSFAFWIIFWLVTLYVVKKLSPVSNYLGAALSAAAVSAFHGLLCGIVGLKIIFQCAHEVILARTPLVGQYIVIGCGYFSYDLLSMYCCHILKAKEIQPHFSGNTILSFIKSRPLIIAHHVLMMCLFFPVLVKYESMGNFIAGCFFAMELSSLFVNIRFILHKLGMESNKLYVFNGLALVFTFMVCRILVFPFIYLCYIIQQSALFELTYEETLSRVPIVCHLSSLIICIPQIYWFSLIVKETHKVLYKSPFLCSQKDKEGRDK